MKRLLHRIAHLLGVESCANECHRLSDGRLLHVVTCCSCGEIVIAFYDSASTTTGSAP